MFYVEKTWNWWRGILMRRRPMSDAELVEEMRTVTESRFHGEGSQGLGAPTVQGYPNLQGAGSAAHARSHARDRPKVRVRMTVQSSRMPLMRCGARYDGNSSGHRTSGRCLCRGRSLLGGLRWYPRSHTRHALRSGSARGVRECFGAVGKDKAAGLTIRHDNGSQYISHDFQNEIAWLGVKSSPSFEGNGCAERFIRTLKENLLWVKTFGT